MGLGQTALNAIWPPSLPLRAVPQKSSLQGAVGSAWEPGATVHSVALTPEVTRNLAFCVLLPRQGRIETPASTPGLHPWGSGRKWPQLHTETSLQGMQYKWACPGRGQVISPWGELSKPTQTHTSRLHGLPPGTLC